MRLFIGIKASSKLQELVLNWQKENKDLPVRFIKPENLHITLIPPWYADDPENAVIKLKGLIFPKFRITFDNIFVNFRNQVVWIESRESPPEIINIRNALLVNFNKPPERRDFKTHITVARFKAGSDIGDISLNRINWEEIADNITLFESVLLPEGANYKIIYTLNLN